jgi:hypothetical protein
MYKHWKGSHSERPQIGGCSIRYDPSKDENGIRRCGNGKYDETSLWKISGVGVLFQSMCHLVILFGDLGTGWRSSPFPSTRPVLEWMGVHFGQLSVEWMDMDMDAWTLTTVVYFAQ